MINGVSFYDPDPLHDILRAGLTIYFLLRRCHLPWHRLICKHGRVLRADSTVFYLSFVVIRMG